MDKLNERWIWLDNLTLFNEMVKKEGGSVKVCDSTELEGEGTIVLVKYDNCDMREYERLRLRKI